MKKKTMISILAYNEEKNTGEIIKDIKKVNHIEEKTDKMHIGLKRR